MRKVNSFPLAYTKKNNPAQILSNCGHGFIEENVFGSLKSIVIFKCLQTKVTSSPEPYCCPHAF